MRNRYWFDLKTFKREKFYIHTAKYSLFISITFYDRINYLKQRRSPLYYGKHKTKSKNEKIRKQLVDANKDKLHPDASVNKFIELQAKMIAEALQLSEEYSD